MEPLSFFDCNCSFGMRRVVNPGSFFEIEELKKRMDRYGIGKALVYHAMAREYDAVVGNGMLINEITGEECFYPMWAVMHHHTGEFPPPDLLIKQMKKNSIKAVCIFPAPMDQNFSIAKWNCGELFTVLVKHAIPIFIGMDQISFDGIYDLCNSFPKLKVVLTGVNYRIDRNVHALLNQLPHFYIEISGYKTHNGIEEMCEKFGAGRLMFGSGMPLYSGASAVSMINYARISEKEKSMIASENLEALLGGVQL